MPTPDRRDFLRAAAAGLAGLATGAVTQPLAGASVPASRDRRGGRQQEPWGRLEPVAPDAWALVSTPLADHPDARRTLCNGGIVAGDDAVLAVEGLASGAGAAWLAREAVSRTGRWPTHVALTHFHGDHTTGTAGYFGRPGPAETTPPTVLSTGTTRRIMAEREAELPEGRREARLLVLPDTLVPDSGPPETLDLGGRTVRLHALGGHTPSDLAIEVGAGGPAAGHVVFAGDLVWNGMFPNYVDAIPGRLAASVRTLRDLGATTYVSGHGAIADRAALAAYLDLLDDVEAAARRAIEAGVPLDRAGAAYQVPASLGQWHMFSPRYPEVAFRAWARELEEKE